MACCGQRREALVPTRMRSTPAASAAAGRTGMASAPGAAAAATPVAGRGIQQPPVAARPTGGSGAPPRALFDAVPLRYLARTGVLVRGPATGIEYRFSGTQPVQRVARADRDALLRTGHFRQEA